MDTTNIRSEFDPAFVRCVDDAYEASQKEAAEFQKVQDAYKKSMSKYGKAEPFARLKDDIKNGMREVQKGWIDHLVQHVQDSYSLTLDFDYWRNFVSTPDEFLCKVKDLVGADLHKASETQFISRTASLLRCIADERSPLTLVTGSDFYSENWHEWYGRIKDAKQQYHDSPSGLAIGHMQQFESFMTRILGDPFTFGRHARRKGGTSKLIYTGHPFETPGSMIQSFTMFKNGKAKIRFHHQEDMDEFLAVLDYMRVRRPVAA